MCAGQVVQQFRSSRVGLRQERGQIEFMKTPSAVGQITVTRLPSVELRELHEEALSSRIVISEVRCNRKQVLGQAKF